MREGEGGKRDGGERPEGWRGEGDRTASEVHITLVRRDML